MSSYLFITYNTDLLCYSVSHMFKVTEEMLILARQPRKLLIKYDVPAAKVTDMIREGTMEMAKREVSPNGTPRDLSPNQVFFAARRHLHKQNVYVVRITYRFQKTPGLKNKYAVLVSGVEVMKEKDYQPILPI